MTPSPIPPILSPAVLYILAPCTSASPLLPASVVLCQLPHRLLLCLQAMATAAKAETGATKAEAEVEIEAGTAAEQ